jgi:Fe-S-cluster-containing dehydrogenase component
VTTTRRRFIKLGTHAAFGSLLVYTARGLMGGDGDPVARAEGDTFFDRYRPEDHEWAFVVDTNKCIGCGRCARACKLENKVPWEPSCNRTWVERYRFGHHEKVVVDSPEGGINGFVEADEEARRTGKELIHEEDVVKSFFVPKLCNQCEKPPCVQVCPVGATYKTADGVVLVNQDRCIGCRYCIQACPYGARYLVPAGDVTPTGQANVADKCTWCYHRITRGLEPACVEACPVGARIFGDLHDPESHVNKVLEQNRIGVLKPELGTKPRVKYLGLDEAVR